MARAIEAPRGAIGAPARSHVAALDWLRPQLTPTELDSIARADFGDVEANLQILGDIQASGLISQPLGGYLPASLEFVRWTAKTDHVMRAFSCALLPPGRS